MKKTIFGVEFVQRNRVTGVCQHFIKFAVEGVIYKLSVLWDPKRTLHCYTLDTLPEGTECFEVALMDEQGHIINDWCGTGSYFLCTNEADFLTEITQSVVEAREFIIDGF